MISGPGTVTFGNANLVDTTATFSAIGEYVLELSATDSELSAADTVTINVSDVADQPPTVSAGPDQTVTLAAGATLDGTVNDDGLPNPPGAVTTLWSVVSGPGTVTFGNANLVDTTASFTAVGTYVLRLTANDGALTPSDDATINVGWGGGRTEDLLERRISASADDAEENGVDGQRLRTKLGISNSSLTAAAIRP